MKAGTLWHLFSRDVQAVARARCHETWRGRLQGLHSVAHSFGLQVWLWGLGVKVCLHVRICCVTGLSGLKGGRYLGAGFKEQGSGGRFVCFWRVKMNIRVTTRSLRFGAWRGFSAGIRAVWVWRYRAGLNVILLMQSFCDTRSNRPLIAHELL